MGRRRPCVPLRLLAALVAPEAWGAAAARFHAAASGRLPWVARAPPLPRRRARFVGRRVYSARAPALPIPPRRGLDSEGSSWGWDESRRRSVSSPRTGKQSLLQGSVGLAASVLMLNCDPTTPILGFRPAFIGSQE